MSHDFHMVVTPSSVVLRELRGRYDVAAEVKEMEVCRLPSKHSTITAPPYFFCVCAVNFVVNNLSTNCVM